MNGKGKGPEKGRNLVKFRNNYPEFYSEEDKWMKNFISYDPDNELYSVFDETQSNLIGEAITLNQAKNILRKTNG